MVAETGLTSSSKNLGLWHRGTVLEEVEVSAFVRLCDVIDEELRVAAMIAWRGGFPRSTTFRQLFITDVQMQLPVRHIEFDEVTVLHEGERAADG